MLLLILNSSLSLSPSLPLSLSLSLPLSLSPSLSPSLPLSLLQGSEWFEAKVDLEVSQASQKAIAAIERFGGKIITAHYNQLGLRLLLKPWKFEDRLKPRRALPNKKLMAYYLNPGNRYVHIGSSTDVVYIQHVLEFTITCLCIRTGLLVKRIAHKLYIIGVYNYYSHSV